MRKLLYLGCLIFSHLGLAQCVVPERFTPLENPLPPEIIELTPKDEKQFPVQIVNFWALWCAPCRAELPFLKQLSQAGVPVFLVNIGGNSTAAQQFLDEIGVADLPQAQLETELPSELGITGFPATFLFENGALRYRTQGTLKSTDEQPLLSYIACSSLS